MVSQFVHLHVHSAYSLAEGAIRIADLLAMCQEYDMPAVALTDSNNMFGAMEFATKAAKSGIQPIIGTQINISFDDKKKSQPDQLVLLAQNEQGYRNLCYLMTCAYMDENSQDPPQILYSDLTNETTFGVIALTGGVKGTIGQLIVNHQKEQAEQTLILLKEIFKDRLYIELQRHGLREEKICEPVFLRMAQEHNIPIVATNDCYFPKKKMHEAHDALLCIAEGRYVNESDRRKVTAEHFFKSAEQMMRLFNDLPEAIENTIKISTRCSWFLQVVDPILPPFDCGEGRNENEEMDYQSRLGLNERLELYVYPSCADEKEKKAKKEEYFNRLSYELNVIKDMGFAGYFLIVADFIQWAKDQKIPVGPGRGSGAASIIAWALKITDLDPIEYNLLFERFLNPERVSMPDFDIDFCQDRRDEVISYVQEKYGSDRVAQIITFGKLQARAVVRDVGRVLQMPYGQVDKIAKMIPSNPAKPVTLQEALNSEKDLREQRRNDEMVGKLIDIALELEGLYRHASTHAAGLVIGDRPLYQLVPVYRDPRSPMPVTQFNMKFVESTGLVKFDFLGLKTLTVLQKTTELVEQGEKKKIDLLRINTSDSKTFEMLSTGANTGVFQLESAGMRDAGRQMRLGQLEEIIALVSLYRPGPMDNIPKYIAYKNGDEEPDYMHPLLEPILKETFGIMIYQEQVMQAAQILSGYTLGSADLLRRAMGKKIQSEMDKQREVFIKGAVKHNQVPEKQASAIFDQIAKFAGYGFNKAHAACYAFISYQTAYMKANYPVEFFTASMTLDRGNTDKLNIFKQELERMGIELLSPDINKSSANFSVEFLPDGRKAVRYALAAIKGVGSAAMESLVQERAANGDFKNIFDLARRVESKVMNKRQIDHLVKAGAFDNLEPNRAKLSNFVETLVRYASAVASERSSNQESLFGEVAIEQSQDHLPKMEDIEPWDSLEKLHYEFQTIGFYLSAHPLDGDEEKLERLGIEMARDVLSGHIQTSRVKMAGVILQKKERTSAKGNRFAFVQLSDPSGFFEVLLFSDTLSQYRDKLEVGQSVIVTVDIQAQQEEGEAPRLTGQDIQFLDVVMESMTQNVHIEIECIEALKKIEEKLSGIDKGEVSVYLYLPLKNTKKQAKVRLPNRYQIKAPLIRALQTIEGISHVRDQ